MNSLDLGYIPGEFDDLEFIDYTIDEFREDDLADELHELRMEADDVQYRFSVRVDEGSGSNVVNTYTIDLARREDLSIDEGMTRWRSFHDEEFSRQERRADSLIINKLTENFLEEYGS